MEAVRVTLYALTIVCATVTWCLAAAFLALTRSRLGLFWRGDVALLVFGILAMLFLPVLLCLGFGHRRRSLTGPTIAEAIAVFIFWSLFLAGTGKFSSSFHHANGWRTQCRVGFRMCPTGRALLSFGWITFGLLSLLFVAVILHGVLAEKERKHREQQGQGGTVVDRQVEPTLANSQATAVDGKQPAGQQHMSQVPQAIPAEPTPLTTTQTRV